MSFDGLCDVFGALGTQIVARKVEGRQRPIILDTVCHHLRTLPPESVPRHVQLLQRRVGLQRIGQYPHTVVAELGIPQHKGSQACVLPHVQR